MVSLDTGRGWILGVKSSNEYVPTREVTVARSSHSDSEESSNDLSGSLEVTVVGDSSTSAHRPPQDNDPLPELIHLQLARSVSMPPSPRLGHLQPPIHPTRGCIFPSSYDEISRELSDSVQAIVQTLLHISPPHILDPVKELFSACTVQLPTPSVSALLTTMKNLNYLSANLRVLGPEALPRTLHDAGLGQEGDIVLDNFDIGEVVQSVGDVLGGIAAQAGVDLAIFHGDVGMRHINVIGDERSLLFILTHITRQILASARPGDAIEIGLHLMSLIQHPPQAEDPLNTPPGEIIAPNLVEVGTPISCTFEITQKANMVAEGVNGSPRVPPKFDSTLIKGLLMRTSTSLVVNSPSTVSLGYGATYSLTTQLVRGPTPQHDSNPPSSLEDDEARAMPFVREPTLEALASFSEVSLRGKRAVFHAQESSTFARHLTSYLTSWGVDIGHMPIGGSLTDNAVRSSSGTAKLSGGSDGGVDDTPVTASPTDVDSAILPPQSSVPLLSSDASGMTPVEPAAQIEPSFVIIDDDVDVLRRTLDRYRPEISPTKRPSLAQNHRPRSSPQIRQVLGMSANEKKLSHSRSGQEERGGIIVHITSLAKYKLVKDAVQSAISLVPQSRIPDIMVIPKPVGPRRFLTALYTAVRKPLVDPYFFPIATSPQSPGTAMGNISAHPARTLSSDQRSGGAAPPTTARSLQQASSPYGGASGHKPPREQTSTPTIRSSDYGTPQTSPMSAADSLGYFAPAAVKMGSSASSGVVLQSPDGRPTGIYFQPQRGSTARKNESRIGTPISRSLRSPVADNSPNSRYPPGASSSRFAEENHPAPLLRERRTSSETNTSCASLSRSKRYASADDNPSTPLIPSLPRPTRSRPGSSRSRPTSAGSSRDANSSSSAPQAARVIASSRKSSVSRQVPGGNVVTSPASASPAASTLPVSSLIAPKLTPIDATTGVVGHSPPLANGPPKATPTVEIAVSVVLPTDVSPGSAASIASHVPSKIRTKQKRVSGSGAAKGMKASNGITPPISVLIAEDNPINQTILTTFMRRRKLKYATANNGAEAVEKWRTGQYHLILMDIQMPLMDGIDATKEIRRLEKSLAVPATSIDQSQVVLHTAPSTPFHSSVIIVALTASSLQSDRVKALAAGCNDFLTKPVSLHWLDKKIIEWGSIKALQMWASPDLTFGVHEKQDARAKSLDLQLPEQPRSTVLVEASGGASASGTVTPACQ